jgi:Protein of unknown function (DUF3168)
MSAALALQQAMREALLAHGPLTTLLGGGHVFDELPRGAKPPLVEFTAIETRDWSVADQWAQEHFVQLAATTHERSRAPAQAIAHEIEVALDGAALTLAGHRLVNLRLVFTSVSRMKPDANFGAILRFRAATEPT